MDEAAFYQSHNEIRCLQCDRTFTAKKNLIRHDRKFHPSSVVERPSLNCSVCFAKCNSMADYQKHIELYHPFISLAFEHKIFYCEEDFLLWKKTIEKATNSMYVKRRGSKTLQDGRTATYYFCHRSGNINLKRDRVRRLKTLGSNKLGFICPAHIFTFKDTYKEAVEIKVKYLSTHVGHDCEPERLPFTRAKRKNLVNNEKIETLQVISLNCEVSNTVTLSNSIECKPILQEINQIHHQYQELIPVQDPLQLLQMAEAQISSSSTLEFFMMIGKLKHLKRTGWVKSGISECETVSGHMHRMALMAFFLEDDIITGLNRDRCIRMAIVHDIAESIIGDITPYCGVSEEEKRRREMEAMERLCSLVGKKVGSEILSLFKEYEEQCTAEAKVVKDLDKFDMVLQAYEYEKEYNNSVNLEQFFTSTQGIFEHPKVMEWAQELMYLRNKSSELSASELYLESDTLNFQS